MSALKIAILLFIRLCYSMEVQSMDPIVSSRNYNFRHQELIIGNHHIDKSVLVFAVCERNLQPRTNCTIKFHNDVFDPSQRQYSCPLDIMSGLPNGIIEILDVNLWDQDKAILTWREYDNGSPQYGKAGIATVIFPHCETSEYRMKNENRLDMIPQIFVLPSFNSYDVVYLNGKDCGGSFCKITVEGDRRVGQRVRWFSSSDKIYALENIDDHSNKLLVTLGDSVANWGVADLYLLSATRKKHLGTFSNIEKLSWSTSNGIISYCCNDYCKQFDHEGKSEKITLLNLPNRITSFATLYNLPDKERLALVCDIRNDHYRLILIGQHGEQNYSFDLDHLKCSRKPDVMTGRFYMKSNGEVCLSLYFSQDISAKNSTFSDYCFFW